MKKLLLILFLSPAISFSQDVVLKSGTNIQIYAANKISSKNLEEGDNLHFYIMNNVIDNENRILIAANTYVKGTVDNLKQAKGAGKQGSMDVLVQELIAADGQKIPVFLDFDNSGLDKQKQTLELAVLIVGPLALLEKGGEAEIKIGEPVTLTTVQDIKFNSKDLQVLSGDNVNKIYDDLILKQLKLCGDEPVKPKRSSIQSNYKYRTSREFKHYTKELKRWNDCMPYVE